MAKLQKWLAGGACLFLSAIGCSDDTDGGAGDGDGDVVATGGFVTNTGGSSGDGDVLDPCFGALVYCQNSCIDLTSDEDHCGACDERCDSDEICDDSVCVDGPGPGTGGAGGLGGGGGFGGGAGSLN